MAEANEKQTNAAKIMLAALEKIATQSWDYKSRELAFEAIKSAKAALGVKHQCNSYCRAEHMDVR